MAAALGVMAAPRPSAALTPAAAVQSLIPDDLDAAAWAARDFGHHALMPWPWADPARKVWVAAAALKDTQEVAVGLLDEVAGGPATVISGPTQAEVLTIDPFWTLLLEFVEPPQRFGLPVVALQVSNGYLSTGRSTDTIALHLFLPRGDDLLPVFGSWTALVHSVDGRVRWRRSYAVEVEGSRKTGEIPPDLVVRDRRGGRVVSRHRWKDDAYVPPLFDKIPPLGPD